MQNARNVKDLLCTHYIGALKLATPLADSSLITILNTCLRSKNARFFSLAQTCAGLAGGACIGYSTFSGSANSSVL